jgi:glycosyltransferase involved in cell wall biosynthesis
MRVALNVEQLLQRPPGGVGHYVAELARRLPGTDPDSGEATEVVAFVARHRDADIGRALGAFGLDGLHPVSLPLPRPLLYDLWNVAGRYPLSRSAALRDVDVVHAPSLAVPPRPARGALVVTAHDAAPLLYPETYPRRGRRFHQYGLRAAAERADLVIAPTRAAADELLERTAIRAETMRVVPHGVDQTLVNEGAVLAARSTLGLGDAPFVLWVGTLEPRKNLPVLLDAFHGVIDAGLPHRLVVVGPPGWRGGPKAAAGVAAGLGDRVVLTGPLRADRLASLYRGASLFAFPSFHEGFGLPVLEAMAQETAVLCSDIPVLREVAGDAARYVPPGDVSAWRDALCGLLRDDAERARLAAAGRARVGDFTWERCAQRTRSVLREAIAGAS